MAAVIVTPAVMRLRVGDVVASLSGWPGAVYGADASEAWLVGVRRSVPALTWC